MNRSIQARLRLLLASVVAISALTTLIGVTAVSRGTFERFLTSTDRERASLIARSLANPTPMRSGMMGMGMSPQMMASMGIFPEHVVVTDVSGKVISDNAPNQAASALSQGGGQPVTVGGRVVGYVYVGSMLSPSLSPFQQEFLRSLAFSLLLSSLVSVLVAFVLGSLLVRALTSPLKQFSAAVTTIAQGNFSTTLPAVRYAELEELALNINTMSTALHDAEVARKQLIADIAHELRTPLTLIQGTLEAMVDGMYPLSMENATTLFDETKHLSRLVEDLRDLSSMDKERPRFEVSPVDLCETVQSVAESFSTAMARKNIGWELSVQGKLPFWLGDQGRLVQVIQNLFSNSVKYCGWGSSIVVSLALLAGAIRLDFSDNGQGIPAADLGRVFERFYRVDKSRTRGTGGTGLGLSIVKGIVEDYRGSVAAFSPALHAEDGANPGGGPGTTIRIELPIESTKGGVS